MHLVQHSFSKLVFPGLLSSRDAAMFIYTVFGIPLSLSCLPKIRHAITSILLQLEEKNSSNFFAWGDSSQDIYLKSESPFHLL